MGQSPQGAFIKAQGTWFVKTFCQHRVPRSRVHVSKCTAGVPPARGRPAGREDEGGRDARGTLWATHLL
ncbi:MAG: hypothetical protein ABSE73_17375, partial [Planctomycetota bacterium]